MSHSLLPAFFDRLRELIIDSPHLSEEVPGPTGMDRKAVVLQHLSAVRDCYNSGPEKWPYNRSVIRGSWQYIVMQTKATGLFEEFKGQVELRNQLEEFLGRGPKFQRNAR